MSPELLTRRPPWEAGRGARSSLQPGKACLLPRETCHGKEPLLKISNIPFCTTDWSTLQPTEHPGAAGKALWRTLQAGDIRIRLVEYTPGYVADHWCSRGHILLVLEGTLLTELKDGRRFELGPMMSYQVSDDDGAHRSSTETGARLFIVD